MYAVTLIQVGVEKMNKDSKYVLFLDDDVRLHPGSIGALTKEMEKNPDVLISLFSSLLLLIYYLHYFNLDPSMAPCRYLLSLFYGTDIYSNWISS